MSTPQDDERSGVKQWFKRKLNWRLPPKHRGSSTRYSDAPDARPTTTATDIPSTSVSRPPPLSPAQGSSCVDVIVNQPSKALTVPGPTGIGDSGEDVRVGDASSIDRHQPGSHNFTDQNSTFLKVPTPTSTSSSFQSRKSFQSDGPPVLANYTGAGYSPRSSRTDVTASQIPCEIPLPSQVEETLAACPKFRILLVGNTGVGKSSLVSSVFNVVFNVSHLKSEDGTAIDVADGRVGKAVITHEYYSDLNPRFILHDSMGFEPGSTEKSEIVKSFLRDRAECNAELPEQVHAIWLCIETPRMGARLLQTGDEELLDFAKQLKIPVIVVLTKYDLLVMEHYRACGNILSLPDRNEEAKRRADRAFGKVTKELKELKVPFAPASTLKKTQREYGGTMLVELTQVTRDNLRDVAGSLWVLWATAQQINTRQKVEHSISEGLKKYWRDLGESVFFEGHPLVDCITRIHDDILKIWNFNDPTNVLSGEEFLRGMIGLVEPLSGDIQNQRPEDIMGLAVNVVHVASAVASGLVLPALGTMIGMKAFQFLLNKYQRGVSTATYLAGYIVDLIFVLFEISTVVTVDPPKSLTRELVMDALDIYKPRSSEIHAQVKKIAFIQVIKPEEKIASVIRGALLI